MGRSPARALVAAGVIAAATGCTRPLPEAGSADEALYRARCGTCHVPHHPSVMTPTMWQVQVERMEAKIRAAGIQAPTPDEKARILDYVTRHAGG